MGIFKLPSWRLERGRLGISFSSFAARTQQTTFCRLQTRDRIAPREGKSGARKNAQAVLLVVPASISARFQPLA
jgi:hypothetical protein